VDEEVLMDEEEVEDDIDEEILEVEEVDIEDEILEVDEVIEVLEILQKDQEEVDIKKTKKAIILNYCFLFV
jgi:hypothetical protein